MIRRPPRSTLDRSSAASDVYKRQALSVYSEIVAHVFVLGIAWLSCEVFCSLEKGDDANFIWPGVAWACLLYTSPSPRDRTRSRMPSSA